MSDEQKSAATLASSPTREQAVTQTFVMAPNLNPSSILSRSCPPRARSPGQRSKSAAVIRFFPASTKFPARTATGTIWRTSRAVNRTDNVKTATTC